MPKRPSVESIQEFLKDSPVAMCYLGYIMSILQVMFNIFNTYSLMKIVKWESAAYNDRLIIIFFYFHYISGSCAVLTSFLYSRRSLLDLCAHFYKLYNILIDKDFICFKCFIALIVFHLLLFSHSVHAYISNNSGAIFEFTYVLVYTAPFAKEILISIMCYVSERTYNNIKHQLRILRKIELNSVSLNKLGQIMDRLEGVQVLNEQIKNIFRLYFLTMFLDFIIHSIISAFIFLILLKKPTQYVMSNTIAHITNVLIRLVFVAYRCQQVLNEANEFNIELHYIRINWQSKIRESGDKKMLHMKYCLNQLKMPQFSACGLFDINLPFTVKITGIMITYSLVTLQTA